MCGMQEVKASLSPEDVQAVIEETKTLKERQVRWHCVGDLALITSTCIVPSCLASWPVS